MTAIPVSPTGQTIANETRTRTESNNNSAFDEEFGSISPFALGIALELCVVAVYLGNLLVLLSLKFQNKLIITDVLLFSLSLADFVGGLIPLQAVIFINYFLQAAWSKVLCDAYVSVVNTCRLASAGTVTLIAVERAVMLVWPFRYHTTVTISRAKKIVFVTWLVSVLVAILPFTGFGKSGYKNDKCFYHLSDLGTEYAIFVLCISSLLLLTVLACSIIIKSSSTKFVRRQSEIQATKAPALNTSSNTKRAGGMFSSFLARGRRHNSPRGVKEIRRLSLMMALVVVLYYVSWLPILITSAVTLITGTKHSKTVVLVTGMTSLIYALANPVLYGKMSARYRRGYKCVIGKLVGSCGLTPEALRVSTVSEVWRNSQISQSVRATPSNKLEARRTLAEINREYLSTVDRQQEVIVTEAKQHMEETEHNSGQIDISTEEKETIVYDTRF